MIYDETAFEWRQRVVSTKRRRLQNPIVFSSQNTPDFDGNGRKSNRLHAKETRFIATPENMRRVAASTFFGDMTFLSKIERRLSNCQHRRRQKLDKKRTTDPTSYVTTNNLYQLETAFLRSFPCGSNIPFIDEAFDHYLHGYEKQVKRTTVVEISGRDGTGRTQVLIELAANYVAALSNMTQIESDEVPSGREKPKVVIFDPECNIHPSQLAHAVHDALLRRLHDTSEMRKWLDIVYEGQKSEQTSEKMCLDGTGEIDYLRTHRVLEQKKRQKERRLLEREHSTALGRIQIIRPRDFSKGYSSAMHVLERILTHSSRKRKRAGRRNSNNASESQTIPPPPTMLLMDSVLSAFEQNLKYHEGLTGIPVAHNEFLRRLKRLRTEHDIFVASTNGLKGKKPSYLRRRVNSFYPWISFISHRLSLEFVPKGSVEDIQGFQFIAAVKTIGSIAVTPFSFHHAMLSYTGHNRDTIKDERTIVCKR